MPDASTDPTFDDFVAADGERRRRALVARHGVDEGCDLANEALAYAWQHWERVAGMQNPVGYLYRVAENAGRKRSRWRRPPPFPSDDTVDPATPVEILRALPAEYPNVMVLDWDELAEHCRGECFESDALDLTDAGAEFYTTLITNVLDATSP